MPRIKPNGIDAKIGPRIRARRLELKMSQSLLGELIGVSFQQVQKYEKGDNCISIGALHQVAQALNADMAYFLQDKPSVVDSVGEAFLATRDGAKIARAFGRMPDGVKHIVVNLAEALAEI